MKHFSLSKLALMALLTVALSACDSSNLNDDLQETPEASLEAPLSRSAFEGAVYAMSNDFNANTLVGYGRNSDGTLTHLGSFSTGGKGAAFDGGEGLDPLISAYSVIIAGANRYVLAVNAGSNTISAMRINRDFTLTTTDQIYTRGVGPNSIAYHKGIVYVSNIDADGAFNGEPDQEGNLAGFRLSRSGKLSYINGSTRALGNRPSAVQFSPDGDHLIVASINAGSSALASGSNDEIVVYRANRSGLLSNQPVSAAASTEVNNPAGRNLASAIGFETVESGGNTYVVVTEAREFQADGSPPAFPQLQTGSISTWQLQNNGSLSPVQLDLLTGNSFTDGERTACWIEFSPDNSYYWVSNALESTLSSFSFSNGSSSLINRVEAAGTPPGSDNPADAFANTDGWVDLWGSDDGKYLYQLYGLDGTIGVFEANGSSLQLVQEVSGDLPEENTQGIVAF